jgi:hypothetical protein
MARPPRIVRRSEGHDVGAGGPSRRCLRPSPRADARPVDAFGCSASRTRRHEPHAALLPPRSTPRTRRHGLTQAPSFERSSMKMLRSSSAVHVWSAAASMRSAPAADAMRFSTSAVRFGSRASSMASASGSANSQRNRWQDGGAQRLPTSLRCHRDPRALRRRARRYTGPRATAARFEGGEDASGPPHAPDVSVRVRLHETR